MKSKHYKFCKALLIYLQYTGFVSKRANPDMYRRYRRTTNKRRLKLFMKARNAEKVIPSIVWFEEG